MYVEGVFGRYVWYVFRNALYMCPANFCNCYYLLSKKISCSFETMYQCLAKLLPEKVLRFLWKKLLKRVLLFFPRI